MPDPRGGTGAAALGGSSSPWGGEEPAGTIAEVLAYRVSEPLGALEDPPTPRHGVGVAALGGRVFVIGGGLEPGLTVSVTNEAPSVSLAARAGVVERAHVPDPAAVLNSPS